jgi:hypothetical protein
MPTDPTTSLMDDSEFLQELEKLERIVPPERTESAFDAGLDGLDAGLFAKSVEQVPSATWSGRPTFDEFDEEEQSTPIGPSRGRIALAVSGFLFLMALGAGAAAYVFRAQVALILR